MGSARFYAYNPTLDTTGVEYQFGLLAISYLNQAFPPEFQGTYITIGPDEDLGCVIATLRDDLTCNNCINGEVTDKKISFWRSDGTGDAEFLDAVLCATNLNFETKNEACTWMNDNGYWSICCQNLPIPTPTPTPLYTTFTIYMKTDESPLGWSGQTDACDGTGTPITVYVNGVGFSSLFDAVVTNGEPLYTGTTFNPSNLYVGQDKWYKEQSSPGGNVFTIGNNGAVSLWGLCTPLTPTPTLTPTLTPTPVTPTPTPTPVTPTPTQAPVTPTPTPPTPTPLYTTFTIYMKTDESPLGWSGQTDACDGTGTPITVYVSGSGYGSLYNAVVTNGEPLYTGTTFIPENLYVGQDKWYKDQSSPGGNVFTIGNDGAVSLWSVCVTPTPTPTPLSQIYTHGAVLGTCSDYCTINYNIATLTFANGGYNSLAVGGTIYGQSGAGFVAYSNVSTDTATGPFKIAQIDALGEVLALFECLGGTCNPI